MKKVVLLTLIALASLSASAANKAKVEAEAKIETAVENVMISGLVLDNATAETLAGAVVTVNGETIYTDLDGNFILKNVKPGKVKLTVSMISYAEQTIEIDSDKISKLDIKLKHI